MGFSPLLPLVPHRFPKPRTKCHRLETRFPKCQTRCRKSETRCLKLETKWPKFPTKCQKFPTRCHRLETRWPKFLTRLLKLPTSHKIILHQREKHLKLNYLKLETQIKYSKKKKLKIS